REPRARTWLPGAPAPATWRGMRDHFSRGAGTLNRSRSYDASTLLKEARMRLSTALVALPVIALTAVPMVVAAETTRTLRAELSPDALGHFVVENLAGTMRVVPGTGPTVVAVATLHAEDDDRAKAMTIEQVTGKQGVPTLRVIYPIEHGDTIRYPGKGSVKGALERMFGGSSTTTEYGGQRVKISDGHGILMYADVEVQVPRHLVDATFRNVVGLIEGHDLDGKILFD